MNIHQPNTFTHRLRQCWWILTEQHWLHKAWQEGYDQHIMDESKRRAALAPEQEK
jgi:hypothetical protein